MKSYIFYTVEGFTQSPNNTEIENCQVLGWSQGKNEKQAFRSFAKENQILNKLEFSEIICQEVIEDKKSYFYLDSIKDL